MPRYPTLSPTSVSLSDTVFASLVHQAKLLATPPYPLHVGDTYREPPSEARAEAIRTADHPRLHNYSAVHGEPALLEAIAETLSRKSGESVHVDEIQVVTGATSGFEIACATLLDPSDEVLLPSPFWPLIRGIVASRGAHAVQIPFWNHVASDAFDVRRALDQALTRATVAIYVNSPNNPTGEPLSESAAQQVVDFAIENNLWVFCDEAYEDLQFEATSARPLWSRPEIRDRVISFHTVSKTYGLAGARVGWVHGPANTMRAIRSVHTFHSYCAPRPMQLAAAAALRFGAGWLSESVALYEAAATSVAKRLGIARPKGGTFAFFEVDRFLLPGEDTRALLERCLSHGVLMSPGSAFGTDYERWVRLCYTAVGPADLARALDRLSEALRLD